MVNSNRQSTRRTVWLHIHWLLVCMSALLAPLDNAQADGLGFHAPSWYEIVFGGLLVLVAIFGYHRTRIAEKKHRHSEARLREIINFADGILSEADADTLEFTYVSPSAERLLGYPLEDWYQPDFWLQHVHPDDREAAEKYCMEHVAKGESHEQEYRFAHRDGHYIWLRDMISVVEEPDKTRRARGLMIDITEHKKTQARLHELIESTDGILWEASATGFTFNYISPSAERLLGYPNENWLQPGFWVDHIHPDDRKWVPDYCAEHTRRGEDHDFEYRFFHANGEVVWLRDIVSVIRENGDVRWLRGLMIDITEQKRIEARLIEQREAVLEVVEDSPVACALSDHQQSFTYVNPAFTRMLGYQVEDISPLDKWRETVYPDPEYRRWVSESWQNKNSVDYRGNKVGSMELRVRCKDGSDITVVIHAAPYATSSAGKERLVVFHDVTQRKQMEDELMFKSTLLATQLEASIDAVLMVDDNRDVVAANQRYLDLWGLTQADIAPGVDSKLQRNKKAELVDIEPFVERLEFLYAHTDESSLDEITFRDGRVFDRYSAPMLGDGGHYYGRLWSYRETTERKRSEELIWTQANFDQLTNLPNRRMLNARLEQEMKKAARSGQTISIMCLDLDHFKEVNDTLGHAMGDELLKAAAQRLLSCVRKSDIVARLGGDEFVVALCDQEANQNVELVADKILKAFKEPFSLGQEVAYISTSIGITCYPQDASEFETLLKNGDQAMYAAKSNGRSGFHFYTASMQAGALQRMHTLNDLRVALKEDQFQLVYQPIVQLATGDVNKAEALLRWHHPERGVVPPNEFIHLAEESGMIVEIGNWVFRTAAQQVAEWRKMNYANFQISVNTSPVQFRDTGDDLDNWFEYLEQLQLDGNALNVEITEGMLMEAQSGVIERLLAFRDAGIHVSLDDFGTGYSSLTYLKKFDIDYLKIDQSFIANLAPGSDDMALCEAIIVMAHTLNLQVIAEGIETEKQRDLLTAAGCDFGQGYLFSKPIAADEFEKLLHTPIASSDYC